MKNLLSLLERFSKALNKDTETKETIAAVIQKRTGAGIPADKILWKDGVLEISASPAVKNEIALKEAAIKDELKEVYRLSVSRIVYK
ncbi:MAG: hypothetical protein UY54_C0008G0011 [Parcubacteria group bacterium GW2011_GWA2_50_10b]|nr:MAG: hypothetical protein UY54_C0008G0011 [Parcubacteria group bacterium GW2011_GWA2_50_10b]